jgi:GABA permease
MRRYLVVANKTLGNPSLADTVQRCLEEGSCRFTVLVPAIPSTGGATWVESEANAEARARVEQTLDWFRSLGAHADGVVGDHWPMAAIGDVLDREQFDEIIISTLPPGRSRWLRFDLPSRVRSSFGLPVTHVVAQPELLYG